MDIFQIFESFTFFRELLEFFFSSLHFGNLSPTLLKCLIQIQQAKFYYTICFITQFNSKAFAIILAQKNSE